MELYVLRIDNYKEWAWENGACSLIGVYDSMKVEMWGARNERIYVGNVLYGL